MRHLIVDEYQDLNPAQETIVLRLRAARAEVCVVGDDDQAIYNWRGGDVRNILTFADRYPTAAQVKLETNFRSSRGILETAEAVITQNVDRLPKQMRPAPAQLDEPGDLAALAFADPAEEAEHIARTILELRGVAFREARPSTRVVLVGHGHPAPIREAQWRTDPARRSSGTASPTSSSG